MLSNTYQEGNRNRKWINNGRVQTKFHGEIFQCDGFIRVETEVFLSVSKSSCRKPFRGLSVNHSHQYESDFDTHFKQI